MENLHPKEKQGKESNKNNSKLKNLKRSNQLAMHIDCVYEPKSRVVSMYHLERLSSKMHLYLVEFDDGKMLKLTSSQMMEWHPDEFVSFLERTLQLKRIE